MSNIIEFRRKSLTNTSAEPSSDLGQILFFTGIRYCRDDDSCADADDAPTLRDVLLPVVTGDEASSERLKA